MGPQDTSTWGQAWYSRPGRQPASGLRSVRSELQPWAGGASLGMGEGDQTVRRQLSSPPEEEAAQQGGSHFFL